MVALATIIPHILFPLYFYPSPSAWSPLYTSLSNYPSLTFDIIINPDSGPGSSTYPNSDFIAGIAELNSYPNANLLGYVHTSYATRDITDVKNEIKKYEGWSEYTKADIGMSGIFFDEAPTAYTGGNGGYMESVAGYAESLSLPTIIFNPGATPDSAYYDLTTYIVVFEDYASDFTASAISAVPSKYIKQASFILHDFNATSASQASIVKELKSAGVGSVDITTVEYDGFSALWTQFVKSVAGS